MKASRPALLLVLLAACAPRPEPTVWTLRLDHGWRLRGSTDTTWFPARVPGTVHTDLLAVGRISDPFSGDREQELRWVEEETWSYRRDFDVDPRWLRRDRLSLVFDGLDTWATVTLNGQPLLETDNMFRRWTVDVGDVLRPGANTLEVTIDPAVPRGEARATAHPWPIAHQEPDVFGTRAFSRKAAYHFGWDWGPRFVTSGVSGSVRLEAWSGVRIVDAWAASVAWASPGADTAVVRFAVELEAAGAGGGDVRLGLRSPDNAFPAVLRNMAAPSAGDTETFETTLRIPAAKLWWPRGTARGAPYLYDIDVDVVQGGHWDRRRVRAGLRTVELITEADAVGESFFFRVNGQPLFARGANVVPPDHFTPRVDSAAYARLVDDAVAANMNMLRVWGGGVYLPDVFYDLADEAGLLVWQDFMFANTLVPGDSAFATSVAAEADHQVRRLRRHPSIALWCGNNEVAEGWANWGWRDDYTAAEAERVEEAYRRIFHEVLPEAVTRLDPSRAYVPSSPRLGWGRPESLTEGDSHYWGVWWGMEPFRVYAEKTPRFASEFGFQALPELTTLQAMGTEEAPVHALTDPSLRAHQKHATGFETIRSYLERAWPVPPDDSLDAWSYVSQLAQAEGVGLALEAHRRNWPITGGTLYWQLNDTWPVVSWSSIDHFGRWKALHYRARDVFAPVAVLADAWADSLAVWVAADGVDPSGLGALHIQVVDFEGRLLGERTADVDGPGRVWAGRSAELLPPGTDPRTVLVQATLAYQGAAPLATRGRLRDIAFLAPPRELLLPEPGVEILSVVPDGSGWRATLTARRFAFAIRLSLDGAGARYSDNFLHLLPGDTVGIRIDPEEAGVDVPSLLRVRHLRSTPQGG